ncbi:hypothetical protein [Streptomyces sp. NPDC017941]|uniref:hypothetical protein n=1 Tax=Streptomyces sp. NPDC017941 TaxID=3365018 RepID=UPI00378E0A56
MLNGWRRYADRCPRLVEAAFLVLLCAATGAQNDRGPGWWPGLLLATPAPDADPAPTGDLTALTAREREVTANRAAS